MARDIGPKIGIDGEAQYRKEIQDIIQQAKTLDAEMRSVASAFDEDTEAKKRNKAVSQEIQKQIEVQKSKIQLLANMAERSAEATGENSRETLQWKEALANAKAQLNNLEGTLESTTKKTSTFSETLKAMLSKELIMSGLNALKDGIVAVGKATMNFGKEVVMAYADFEQLEGGVQKLFGEDSQTVIKNAERAYKTAGMSANEYMETVTGFAASLVSSMAGNTKEAAQLADVAIQDMSDNANTFGTDMQSIQNAYQGFAKGQYNMLDNLKLGYGGTKTEMERLILDAEKLDSSFKANRATNGDLTMSFDDIVKAIHVVQNNMNITGTTAKEASKTVSGSIDSMKSAFKNLVIGLGTDQADIDALLGNVVESFEDVVTNVQPIIERFIDYIPGLISAVIPVLQSMAPQLISTAVQLVNALVNALISTLPSLIPVAVDTVMMLANTIVQNLPTIIDAGIELIIALINGFSEALPDLVQQIPVILGHLISAIVKNLPRLVEAGANMIQAIINGLLSLGSGVSEAAYNVLVAVQETFTSGFAAAYQWGKDLIYNFGNGIIENAKAVWDRVKEVAGGIRELLHFSEPDKGPLKDFNSYAPDMMRTFAEGIKKNAYLVENAASQAAGGVANAMNMSAGTSNAYNYGGFNIAIYQQPGQSADALVDELMVKMQNRIDARKAVYA